jgi:hypothetical protein
LRRDALRPPDDELEELLEELPEYEDPEDLSEETDELFPPCDDWLVREDELDRLTFKFVPEVSVRSLLNERNSLLSFMGTNILYPPIT